MIVVELLAAPYPTIEAHFLVTLPRKCRFVPIQAEFDLPYNLTFR